MNHYNINSILFALLSILSTSTVFYNSQMMLSATHVNIFLQWVFCVKVRETSDQHKVLITSSHITGLNNFVAPHTLLSTFSWIIRKCPCFSEPLYQTSQLLCAAAMLSKNSPVPNLDLECGIGESGCLCSPCCLGRDWTLCHGVEGGQQDMDQPCSCSWWNCLRK